MAEMIGGDIGTQILNAIQGLGVRMDRLETRVSDLDSRMARQEKLTESLGARLESLEIRFLTWRDGLNGEVQQLRRDVQRLGGDVQRLGGDVQRLGGDVQRLGGDVLKLRGEVQHQREDFRQLFADMQEGFRRLNARNEFTAGAVVMVASVLRRPTELGEDLEKRLRELQTH
jgi:predicted RNase H-like nuclease (RuvC/YqgF family)